MTYVWLPSSTGDRMHAVPMDETIVDGKVRTACSGSRWKSVAPVTDGIEREKCSNCLGAVNRECGTYAGYIAHKKRSEKPCTACYAAYATYTRERRRRFPESYKREQKLVRSQNRALWRLASLYPAVFDCLVAEELAKDAAS